MTQITNGRFISGFEKPGELIVDTARKENATYVIMGRRGQGKLRRTVLGSVSDFVIHHIHCPIIVSRTWLVVVVQRDVLCFRLKVFPLNRLPDTDFFGIMEENLHVHHCDCVHSLSIFVMKWIFSMNWGCFYIPVVSWTGCCWVPCYYCVSIFILMLNMMCEMVQDLWTWFLS